ncbi:hypothetical protein [Sphingomonas sp. M1A8_2b]
MLIPILPGTDRTIAAPRPRRSRWRTIAVMMVAAAMGAFAWAAEHRLADAIDDHMIATLLMLIVTIVLLALVSPMVARLCR